MRKKNLKLLLLCSLVPTLFLTLVQSQLVSADEIGETAVVEQVTLADSASIEESIGSHYDSTLSQESNAVGVAPPVMVQDNLSLGNDATLLEVAPQEEEVSNTPVQQDIGVPSDTEATSSAPIQEETEVANSQATVSFRSVGSSQNANDVPSFEQSLETYLSHLSPADVDAIRSASTVEEKGALIEKFLSKEIDEQYALAELEAFKKQLSSENLKELENANSVEEFNAKLEALYFDYIQRLDAEEAVDTLIQNSTEDEYRYLIEAKTNDELADRVQELAASKSKELKVASGNSLKFAFAAPLLYPVLVAAGKAVVTTAAIAVTAYGIDRVSSSVRTYNQARAQARQRVSARATTRANSQSRNYNRRQAQVQSKQYAYSGAGQARISQYVAQGSYSYRPTYTPSYRPAVQANVGRVASGVFYNYATNSIPAYNLSGKQHTVAPNESVWGISNRYRISMNDLVTWNGITNNFIYPGQKLLVKPDQLIDGKHQVLPNESVWSISHQYGISMSDFVKWNNIKNNTIHPGQKVIIKAGATSQVSAPTYTVKSGDSVWRIAHNHGITMSDLVKWNNIKNNTIHPGQRLVLSAPSASVAATNGTYTVKSGDSVWRIANNHGITMSDLIKWNNIKNNTIHPGQSLVVKAPIVQQPSASTANNTGTYKVKSGDSVWRIAHDNGISMSDLVKWNQIVGNLIHPGQELVLKAPARAVGTPKTYQVKSGDSVWGIAHQHGITMQQLIEWNGIKNYTIHPNQSLRVEAIAQVDQGLTIVTQPKVEPKIGITTTPKVETLSPITTVPKNSPPTATITTLPPVTTTGPAITTVPQVDQGVGIHLAKREETSAADQAIIDNFIKGLENITDKGAISPNYNSTGGYEAAVRDFHSLNLYDVKATEVGWVGKLPDGTKVSVRGKSSERHGYESRPTLEFQAYKITYKVRY